MTCSRFGQCALLLAFGCTAAGLTGCVPTPTEVSGTIKLKGQAPTVKGLEICFMAADGRTFSAPIKSDGSYTVNEVPSGDAKVTFTYVPPSASAPPKSRLAKPGAAEAHRASKDPPNPIPTPLRDASTSKLTVNLVAGQRNDFSYDIKP